MAIDEAILEAVGTGSVPTTLRFYDWQPPCLSLGYAQPISDADQGALMDRGWDLVRRPTGGRAILHIEELTYSVIGSHHEPRLAGSVLESYQRLSRALLEALQQFGAEAESKEQEVQAANATKGPVCFETPSHYEITVRGKKIIGSAQARRKEGILQHGSLPLTGEINRIVQVLSFPDEASRNQAASRLAQRAATLESVLGSRVNWLTVAQTLQEAFSHALNLQLEPGSITEAELQRAQVLIEQKYRHPSWNFRV